jgi:hypothetical protein
MVGQSKAERHRDGSNASSEAWADAAPHAAPAGSFADCIIIAAEHCRRAMSNSRGGNDAAGAEVTGCPLGGVDGGVVPVPGLVTGPGGGVTGEGVLPPPLPPPMMNPAKV